MLDKHNVPFFINVTAQEVLFIFFKYSFKCSATNDQTNLYKRCKAIQYLTALRKVESGCQ